MSQFPTEQEAFWSGQFGDDYVDRNKFDQLLASNYALFYRILSRTRNVSSVIEFGANIGLNLRAIQQALPNARLTGVEINEKAAKQLEKIPNVTVLNRSILAYQADEKYDLSLIKLVLIHINPECLNAVYDRLYSSSSRYICIAEYYNPTPVTVTYRGHENRLFKRDFAGEMLDRFKDLSLLDYGFGYHRDPNYPQDDVNWFLLEKKNPL